MNETQTRKQIEIEEVNRKAQERYEIKLQQSLQDLREAYEQPMSANKASFTAVNDKKIQDIQAKLAGERGSVAGAIQEMKDMSTRVEKSSRVKELEVNNHALQSRLKELQVMKPIKKPMKKLKIFFFQEQMDNQARQHRADMAKKDHEIEFLNDQHTALTQEYQELCEIKIDLDMEIATYRTLLEGEEVKLGLSQTEDTSHRSETTLGRSKKRKRMMEEEYMGSMISTSFTQPGDLLIEPLEEDFKCIKVTNKGEMVNLNGFKMASTSDMQHYLKPYIPNIQAEQPIIINLGMPNY